MSILVLIFFFCCCHRYSSQPVFESCQKSNSSKECQTVIFKEELLPGTVVDTFTFIDTVSPLTFKITLKGTNLMPVSYLSLNARSRDVDLVVSSRIDYEDFRVNGRTLYFTIDVTGSAKATFNFYISTVDVDDCSPVFQNISYSCTMNELDQSEKCSKLTVSDQDLVNNVLYFRVLSSTTGSPSDFSVDKDSTQLISNMYVNTYTLSLNKPLNYDMSKLIEVIIEAKDSANHTALNSIRIFVNDVPSNPPIFQNLLYMVRIQEGLPVGAYVTTVHAIDGDTGINSPISYRFNDSIFNQYFSIHSSSGIITISKTIIREQSDNIQMCGMISLYIVASKDQKIVHNSSQATLNIQIIDTNKYSTEFSRVGTTVSSNSKIISDKDWAIYFLFSFG